MAGNWPAGEDEISRLVRRHDWAATPLGPIEAWPPVLCATVDMLLAHGFPMVLLWGRELVQIYNRGYRRIMGSKHPGGLGQPTRECWPEVWHINEPIYDRVWGGETLTYEDKLFPIARHGDIEDAWFTLTYSPISASGTVGGVLVTVFEVTAAHFAATKRAQAEKQLQTGEQRFRALVTTGIYSLYSMSADWRRMNRLIGNRFLTDTSQARDDWMERYILPQDRAEVWAAIDRAIASRSSFELEHRVRRTDGSIGWTHSRAVPILGEDGAIVEWFGVANDITERKSTEERLRQFGEASSNVLWIRDADTLAWEYLSPAFETIYGVGVEDALAGNGFRNWIDLVVPEDREVVLANFDRVRAGEHVTFECRIRRPNGEVRWLRNTDFPIVGATGRVERIGGVGHDITESRLAQERLAQNEERLRSAVEVGRLGLWDWNVRTGEIHWSDEHFRMEGYAVGEVTPSFEAWAARIHPEDRPGAEAELERARATGEEYVREFRVVHPDGSIRWLYGRGRFFYDEVGGAVRMVGAMVDTTQRRTWEESQKVLIAELQHRTLNLIGVVQSMADKTAHTSRDLADFETRFAGRLQALARVQGLLSRLRDHDRVTFDELLRTELTAMTNGFERIILDGPPGVRLRSSTVQTLALALHELATNAVKYGALGQAGARLTVAWRLQAAGVDGKPWLHIDWQEGGVRMPAGSAGRRGSGRELIERALPYQLGAETTYALGPDGVRCSIAIPVSETTADPRHR